MLFEHYSNLSTDPEIQIWFCTWAVLFFVGINYTTYFGKDVHERREPIGTMHSLVMLASAVYLFITKDFDTYQYMPMISVAYGVVDMEYHLFRSNKATIHRLGLVLHHICLIGQGWVVKNPLAPDSVIWLDALCFTLELSTLLLNMRGNTKKWGDAKAFRFWSKVLRPAYLINRPVFLSYVWWCTWEIEMWGGSWAMFWVSQICMLFLYSLSAVFVVQMYSDPHFCELRPSGTRTPPPREPPKPRKPASGDPPSPDGTLRRMDSGSGARTTETPQRSVHDPLPEVVKKSLASTNEPLVPRDPNIRAS